MTEPLYERESLTCPSPGSETLRRQVQQSVQRLASEADEGLGS